MVNRNEIPVVLFLSYAREDEAFARRLGMALAAVDIRVTGDWQLTRGDSYRDQLRLMILSCDAFLFILSPDSVASSACRDEVDIATQSGKRLLPVSYRDHGADEKVPAALREPQWTFMRTEATFGDAVQALNVAARTDFGLAREHQRLSIAAESWRLRGETRVELLRGQSLQQAERWLAAAGANPRKLPKPSALVSQFIVASQANRRYEVRRNLALVTILAVVLGAVAVYALNQRSTAMARGRIASSQRLAAQAEGLRDTQPDLSLLLAGSSWKTDPTPAAHGALVNTLQYSPHLARYLHDHAAPVHALGVSEDGHLIASGDALGVLLLHDGVTGRRLADWKVDAEVTSAAFSRDGKRLASGDGAGRATLWDSISHRTIWTAPMSGGGPQILSVAFSPDNSLLAISDIAGNVQGLDASSGTPVGPRIQAHSLGTWAAVFVTGDLIATGGWDGTIAIWNVRTGREVRPRLTGHGAGVRALSLSPDGNLLASASLDGTVALWDWSTAKRIGPPLRGHTGYVETVAFSSDGAMVASSGQDRSIRLWDVKSHALLSPPLQGHQRTVWNLRFMPSGTALVSASDDGDVLLWDLATPSPLARPLAFEGKGVGDLTVSRDGRWLAAADIGGNVVLWRCHDGTCEHPALLTGHTKSVWKVATAPSGDVVASAGVDRTVRLWSLPAGTPMASPLLGPTADIYGLAFSPDGETLAASDHDGTLYFWQWRRGGDAERVATGHRTGTTAIAFTPDGTRVAVAADTEVVLVDPRTHARVAEIGLAGTLAKDVAISKNGQIIAVATADNQIRLFNTNGLAPLRAPLVGHQSPVSGMAFSPDGRWLASGDEKTVIVWDLQTERPLSAPLHVHTSTVSGVAFDPASGRLITGDWDGRILLWDFTPARLLRLVCQRAARELTRDEFAQYIDVTSTGVECSDSSPSERWALDGPSRVLSKPPADGPPPEQPISIGVLGILNQMVRDRPAQTTSTTSRRPEAPKR